MSVVRGIARGIVRPVVRGVVGTSGALDPYNNIPSTIYIDYENAYVERTGAVSGLTPAGIGDPVGTITDRTGVYVFRAPSDAARATLRQTGGKRYLEKTAGQYYVSADAASSWKWLHDGTNYSIGTAFKAGTTDSPDAAFTLLATNATSAVTHGMWLTYDDRSASLMHHRVRLQVMRGVTASRAVDLNDEPGVSGNRWNSWVGLIDPDNATAADRGTVYSFGRKSQSSTVTNAPSADNPLGTLTIGATTAGTQDTAGALGPIIIYQGTWTESEVAVVERFLDFGGAGRYSVSMEAASISDQVADYEAFPSIHHLANGNLLTMWRAGSSHVGTKGTVTVAISSDGGETWSKTANAISHATYDLRDPGAIVLPSGKIIAWTNIYIIGDDNAGFFTWSSDDNGATWSLVSTTDPPTGYEAVFPFGQGVVIDGKIVVAAYVVHDGGTTHDSEAWESADEGVTWSKRSLIAANANESSIINVGGTNWVAVCRNLNSNAGLKFATSSDDCATWSAVTTTSWPGVSPCLFKVGSTVYCAIGDRHEPGGVRILVWSDGMLHGNGENWLVYRATTVGSDEGYPSAVVSGRTVSLVGYDETSADPGVFFMRFTLPDFGSV